MAGGSAAVFLATMQPPPCNLPLLLQPGQGAVYRPKLPSAASHTGPGLMQSCLEGPPARQ